MVVGGWAEVRRVLQEPIDPTIARNFYLGFSLHRMHPELRDKAGLLSEATLLLRSSQDPLSVLGVGLSSRDYWVVVEQGGRERSDKPETGEGPFFVVAKTEFNPLRGNQVSVVAYENLETVPAGEPDRWDFVTRRQ